MDGSSVTAVLVVRNGAAWLPAALAALDASTVMPGQVVVADTASTDGSRALLAARGPVLDLPATTGYGAAVAAALATVPSTAWIWLLHDDAAPDPSALEALMAYGDAHPDAALLGPKVRDWDDLRLLVEVGLTTDPSGHRHTGIDGREYDQGQRDDDRDVLAVGTAGALVRRSVWDEVGGLDPALPVFRDDLDLGWRITAAGHRVVVVPRSTLRHARAATTGRRELTAVSGRPGRLDRRHALLVLLAHASGRSLPLLVPALLASSLLRAVGFLLSRQVLAARDEVRAVGWVLLRPGLVRSARAARRRTRRIPAGNTRALLAGRTDRLRSRLEVVAAGVSAALTQRLGGEAVPLRLLDPYGGLGDAGPDGPDAEAELVVPAGPGLLRLVLRQPSVLLVLGLTAVALLAERSLLRPGPLLGGRLLPIPDSASALWSSYATGWHDVAGGTATAAAPVVAALAGLSTLLLGRTGLAVDLLLLGSVPLAAASAYVAAGRLTSRRLLRGWAAATWALLPVATIGIATGRLDVAAVQVAGPLLLIGGAAVLRDDPRQQGWRRAWALGLGLAMTCAFAPLLWPVAALLLLAPAVATRSASRIGAALIAAAVPTLVLGPWLLAAPGGLLAGPGRVLAGTDPGGWRLLLLNPGGSAPTVLLGCGLLGAALAGLLHAGRQTGVRRAWLLAGAGLALAAALARAGTWPGLGLQVAAAGMLGAAVLGAQGLRQRLAASSFGGRQVGAAALVGLAALTPVGLGLAWLAGGVPGPLTRDRTAVLPAFARAELAGGADLRVLALRAEDGRVAYDLSGPRGPVLGDADLGVPRGQTRRLDGVVADLLTVSGSDAAQALAGWGVRYVALTPGPGSDAVADGLDAQPGLTRRASGAVVLWRVVAPAARLTVLSGDTAAAALAGRRAAGPDALQLAPVQPLAGLADGTAVRVGPGRAGRLVVLAETAAPGWRATYDGRPLVPRTAWGWAQGFELPANGGVLRVHHDSRGRPAAVALQGLALAVVVVLAGPGARRRRGLEVVDEGAA